MRLISAVSGVQFPPSLPILNKAPGESLGPCFLRYSHPLACYRSQQDTKPLRKIIAPEYYWRNSQGDSLKRATPIAAGLLFCLLALTTVCQAGASDPLLINLTSDDGHRSLMAISFGQNQLQRGHPLTVYRNDKAVRITSKKQDRPSPNSRPCSSRSWPRAARCWSAPCAASSTAWRQATSWTA